MDITLTIPDDKAQLIITAFCDTQGYVETATDDTGSPIPNPETRAAFTKRMVAHYIKTIVNMYQRKAFESSYNPTDVDIT